MGTAVLYPMALLRVADYLQIDRQRAPAVLLQLRNPQSPISVQEWMKHLAVESINPASDPPRQDGYNKRQPQLGLVTPAARLACRTPVRDGSLYRRSRRGLWHAVRPRY